MESRGEAERMVVEGGAPDPREARSAPEFIALLRVLKDASGLTLRELARRADAVGDVLPRSTIANMLGRTSVPREELLAAFVRACGCGPAEAANWLAVRKELTARGQRAEGGGAGGSEAGAQDSGTARDAPAGLSPEEPPERSAEQTPEQPSEQPSEPPTVPVPAPSPARRRRSRTVLAAVVSLVVLAAAVAVVLLVQGDDRTGTAPVTGPVAGRTVQIRSVHSGFCLSEHRSTDSGRLYQLPCDGHTIPSFSLRPLGDGVWRLVTDHPDYGKGCTGVWNGTREAGASMQDQTCGSRGAAEAFWIEPVGRPVEGYRIRPAHTHLCVGAEAGSSRRDAELVQMGCDGVDRGSLFSFDPVAADAADG
ncbi:helix-turn-helix domain-containing protein [Streptomyces sp. NBC_00984]|uniref:helix-turn-helix domain-containing protein n=1 Tax=Streptomyces sp. NBC_00984 TaxID=2903700 RepID=UPI003866C70C|nr:helix-turn-helix domain-containing protein [Streptomyces sp. NBC_00984]